MPPASLVDAIAAVAEAWRDPEHPPRREAVARTLACANTFTEEAVAFAINQQMAAIAAASLDAWVAGRFASHPLTVTVLNAGNIPLVGLQDWLAVVLSGHRYVGVCSSRSPHLLPAFAGEVCHLFPALASRFMPFNEALPLSEAVIASGNDETAVLVEEACAREGIPEARQCIRGHRFSVAVLDGRETEDDRERLAEDALLHEGRGCRNVAVIWAPESLPPDAYLDAFAAFRGVFPAHESTPARLKMPQAMLQALGTPHGYGEDLSFLPSKGDPEPREPGHVRWSVYERLGTVEDWLSDHAGVIQVVVARDAVRDRLGANVPLESLGDAQRPPLDWQPDGRDTIAWLCDL